MNSRASSVDLLILFGICLISPCLSYSEELYSKCSKQFNCGNINKVDYPFWGGDRPYGCGHPGLKLNCDPGNIVTIEIKNVTYRVLNISTNDQILKIAREDYMGGICPPSSQLVNTTLDSTLFEYVVPGYMNLTFLYGCPKILITEFLKLIPVCVIIGFPYESVYVSLEGQGSGKCNTSVIIPIPVPQMDLKEFCSSPGWDQVFGKGFEVKWKVDSKACSVCTNSLGRCGYDLQLNNVTCICPNDQALGSTACPSSPPPRASWAASPPPAPASASWTSWTASPPPPGAESSNGKKILPIGVAIGVAGFVGIFLGFFFFYIRQRRKKIAAQSKSKDLPTTPSSKSLLAIPTTNFSQSNPSYTSSRSDVEKGSTYFGVHVFTYAELEEATNNFDPSKQLGEGGFGTVYYGKLHDGRAVAVKRLYENNFKRVEQFMNEVEILTRLRHPNLVMLYGCTSRRSRELLLVYEYIPNGTVADHLHGKKANSGLVTWPVRLSIAIETAEALSYLHASDIIHRDVKTNNILLDNDFSVKVADFGLSRLFPNDVTHVSTAPQGTPGYVDPEYYQCYKLTDKSDVYSFGVVLIELISSKEAVDTNRHRHEINLANMAVNKIQNQTLNELVDPCLGFETDYSVRRMTTAVAELAFRCLQQEKDMRPSMEEVLRILRGIESEKFDAQKPEVVDIRADDIGLLKSLPPPISPDSIVNDNWVPNSF